MMQFERSEIRWLGFAILIMSIASAFFIFGMFNNYPNVQSILFTLYLLGLSTTIGLMLMPSFKNKSKKGEK